jgi:hypothetical protein
MALRPPASRHKKLARLRGNGLMLDDVRLGPGVGSGVGGSGAGGSGSGSGGSGSGISIVDTVLTRDAACQ